MGHGSSGDGGGGGDGALAVVPVEAKPQPQMQRQTALDVPPFLIFEKCRAPELLECHACHLPLKPLIFSCDDGHLMCSSCRGAHGEDCGRVAAPCRLADAYAGAVKLPCDYVKFGCEAGLVVYHDSVDHRRACQHAPCCCPERDGPWGGGGCDFTGSREMLLEHISTNHSRQVILMRHGQTGRLSLPLARRWQVLVDQDDMANRHRSVFLVILAERDKDAAVSLVCVRADGDAPGAPQFSYKLAVEHTGSGARVTFELPVMKSSSLPAGTPWPDEFTSLSVPKAYLSDDIVPLNIHIDKHVAPPPPPADAPTSPPLPPPPPLPPAASATTAVKSAPIDQGSKKRKSTNPKKL
ncbi:putative E3 ubiquitin-protein ligase SINA-like 6 [Triticum aestivum]|uniref:putative E3 ubiquitin-protein ligase SINA-like 6 n=1 Tax=Triticum aestivum TaxID=4565 RepID=UPI001D0026FF|nr:putative E3 ubiquitin-protein ligase SINA-like 6 [Triticum aestivum]